jgi:tRNA-Thr(GGU) m(6)t(6)A37 methyltransferase TsaA
MRNEQNEVQTTFQIYPIGFVKRADELTYIEILEKYRSGLRELETFSHAQVLWWCSGSSDAAGRETLQFDPPFDAPTLGVFASRAPARPNPIALSNIRITRIDNGRGIIETPNIDAFENSPVLDIKAYMPLYCRVAEPRMPSWTSGWPVWMPENGIAVDEPPKSE